MKRVSVSLPVTNDMRALRQTSQVRKEPFNATLSIYKAMDLIRPSSHSGHPPGNNLPGQGAGRPEGNISNYAVKHGNEPGC